MRFQTRRLELERDLRFRRELGVVESHPPGPPPEALAVARRPAGPARPGS